MTQETNKNAYAETKRAIQRLKLQQVCVIAVPTRFVHSTRCSEFPHTRACMELLLLFQIESD